MGGAVRKERRKKFLSFKKTAMKSAQIEKRVEKRQFWQIFCRKRGFF